MSDLICTRPELLGIDPDWITAFLDRCRRQRICMHGMMLLRHGQVASECYWAPYRADEPHRLYSATKSFVAIAIGMLYDRGQVRLDDPIVRYFPDVVEGLEVHPWVRASTVRDLLRMTTAYSRPTYDDPDTHGKDWLRSYFTSTPDHPPGAIYNYDSCGSYVLGALVRRVTGMHFCDFLQAELFPKLGCTGRTRCLLGPDGESWAGSGILITLRDLARVAQMMTNEGRWEGAQLLSRAYVRAAISRQTDNAVDYIRSPWKCGYGYQIRVMPDGSFNFQGLGGQLAVGIPEKDFVFVCNADTQSTEDGINRILDILWEEIVDRLADPMPLRDDAYRALEARIRTLAIAPCPGELTTPQLDAFNGVRYVLDANPMGITDFTLHIDGDEGAFVYQTPRGLKTLRFGLGKNALTTFPETHFNGDPLGTPAGREFRTLVSAAWVEAHKLTIHAQIIDEYLGQLVITLSFKGDEVAVAMFKKAQFFLKEYEGFAGGRKA